MFAYSPEKFASLYASELGQRIWAFLTLPENVARLETASELSKPAVEGIEEQLLAEFREDILSDIEILEDKSAALQAEIDAYRHRASLMDPRHLDPDIVVERARAMLNMAHADDVLVMVNPQNGQPISGQFEELIDDQLISIIEADSTL